MIFRHNGLEIELDDEWLACAGALNFKAICSAYVVDKQACGERKLCLISIDDIAPAQREHGIPLFNHDPDSGLSAKERTVRILRALVVGAPLPPIQLTRKKTGDYLFALQNGTHRLYSSLALGFTHVPAIRGFDLQAFDSGTYNDSELC